MATTYPPELEHFIEQELATGKYESKDELVLTALQVFRELQTRHQQLRDDVQRSVEQEQRGEVVPLDIPAMKDRLTARLDESGQPKT